MYDYQNLSGFRVPWYYTVNDIKYFMQIVITFNCSLNMVHFGRLSKFRWDGGLV